MDKRVFVVQDPAGKNITSATRFGNLIQLRKTTDSVHLNVDNVIQEIANSLYDAATDDYLLPIGDPAAIIIAAVILAMKNDGIVNVLKWDNQSMCYYPVRIQVKEEDIY